MTYNICLTEPWCSDAPGSPPLTARTDEIYAQIAEAAPDVLAIQEGLSLFSGVENVTYDSGGNPTSAISQSRLENQPGTPSTYFTEARTGTAYTVAFDPTVLHGIGLYINPARFSIVQRSGQPEVEALLLGVDPQVTERAGVERRTPRYAIYAHLHDKRSGQDLWVANIHTSEGTSRLETTERLAQVTAAADRAKRFDGPVIFLGDFNQARTPQADPILEAFGDRSGFIDSQDLAKGIENVNIDSYQGWATVPRTTPDRVGRHIDRVLVRGEVEIGYWALQAPLRRSAESSGSDHVPIVVSLTTG